jgi:hypothetical protein
VRNFHTRDGGRIREKLLALSDFDYSCSYSRSWRARWAWTNYIATLKLTPVTDGGALLRRVERRVRLRRSAANRSCPSLIGGGVFQGGFDALKRHFGGR